MPLTHDQMMEMRRLGQPEEALRVALVFLAESASDHYAWYTAASLCVEIGAKDVGIAGLAGVGEEFAESGNLPLALVAIREIEESGGDASDLTALVSVLYGKGSARVRNRVMPPPPLPPRVDEQRLDNLRPEASFLVPEADRLMSSASESSKLARSMLGKGPDVPYFPMFSALSMDGFLRLLSAFHVKRFASGEAIMEQGKPSDELVLLARGEVGVHMKTSGGERKDLAVLGPGALLGEMGMVARTPRGATVEARTDGIALVAPIDTIEEIADEWPEVAEVIVTFCEIRLLENVMTVSPILDPLEPRDRTRAIKMFDRLFLDPREVAIEEGDEAKGIFLVVNGQMAVVHEGSGKKGKKDSVYVTTLKAGDVFGEISTVMNKPATATVRSVDGTALLFLPKDRFIELTRGFPAVFQRIYEISQKREQDLERIAKQKASSADDLIEE